MSTQRKQKQSSVRVKTPDQPKAPAIANGKKGKEQRDHHSSDIDKSPERAEEKGAPKRGSRKILSKKEKDPHHDCESEDKPNETPAPKKGSINGQSKKQRDLSNRDGQALENSEEKSGAACRTPSVHNKANNAGGDNDRQEDSAKSKRVKRSKKTTNPQDGESEDKPNETPAPKRGSINGQSKKQRDLSNRDGQALENSEEKSGAACRTPSVHNKANNAGGDNDRQEDSAKSKRVKRSKKTTNPQDGESEDKPNETPAPKRGSINGQSKKQRDLSNRDGQALENSEEKSGAACRTPSVHNKANNAGGDNDRQEDSAKSKRVKRSKKTTNPQDGESEDKPNETPAPKRGSINGQSKKQRDLSNRDGQALENSEEKSGAACRTPSVHNKANNAGGDNDRQEDSAKSKRVKRSKKTTNPQDGESEDKPNETPAPKRGSINGQSKKQRDLSNRDGQALENSEEKSGAACRTPSVHNKANNAGGDNDRQEDSAKSKRVKRSKKTTNPQDGESEDKPNETPAPKRGSINGQSKKQRDLSNRDGQALENSEEKNGAACRGASVPNAGENDRQEKQSKKTTHPQDGESEDKPQRTAKSKSGEKTAPSKKQEDPSNIDREEYLESKSEEKSVAKLSARKQKSAEETTAVRGLSVDVTLGKVLKATIEKLKIKKHERSNASTCVNGITDKVIAHLKQNTTWCADIESLRTGSYYENVKICEPDEFDVMLTIPVERVDLEQFDEAGAFYSVALKRHPNKHPLDIFLNEDKTIQASRMLSEFRDAVKEAVEKLQYKIVMQRKKPRCPAVTLEVIENGKIISIDFVLGLKVHRASWPDFTKNGFKIENWLGKKEKADMKRQPFYLVPKYVGKGDAEHDGVVAKDAWRISFSHVEKDILRRHGHSKTCCENGGKKCCRKECLKLLKYLLQQLKEDDSNSNKMSNFCSYHAKTTLLHACAKRENDSQWASSQLADCFLQLLEDFVKHLRDRHLPNFFIPSHNLLLLATPSSCEFLANAIESQRNNNFPIFS